MNYKNWAIYEINESLNNGKNVGIKHVDQKERKKFFKNISSTIIFGGLGVGKTTIAKETIEETKGNVLILDRNDYLKKEYEDNKKVFFKLKNEVKTIKQLEEYVKTKNIRKVILEEAHSPEDFETARQLLEFGLEVVIVTHSKDLETIIKKLGNDDRKNILRQEIKHAIQVEANNGYAIDKVAFIHKIK